MSRKRESPAIGIDLGTTYSCVGVWKNNLVEIIVNGHGNRTTPSCVEFTESGHLVGDDVNAVINPFNTIDGVKRLIGRRFDDESVQSVMKLCSYKIIPGQDRMPLIVVRHKGKEKRFTPEEISSMILLKMRSVAEVFLGVAVTDAVITVPAYFNDSQRKSTEIAGRIAGLNVFCVINEPTAAAIAYGLDEIDCFGGRPKKVLVFDLGVVTLDVSLLHISPGRIPSVIAISGEAYLGGEDFDTNMVAYIVNFIRIAKRKNLAGNAKALWRLRTAYEGAKRNLSSAPIAEIVIDSLYDGIDFSSKITRAKFEGINSDLFNRVMESVKRCLAKASTDKKDVDGVISSVVLLACRG